MFLQVRILVAFSHPKENAREISDKGFHAKAAYHRPIGIEGKVSSGTNKAPITISSNTTGSSVFTPSYTSASPPFCKIMSAGPGMGKKLIPSLDTEETYPIPGRLHQRLCSPLAVSTSHQGPSWPIRGGAGEERRGEAPPRHGCPAQEGHGPHGDRVRAKDGLPRFGRRVQPSLC